MKIQWLGHSSFKLEESTGTSVVTDPYSNIGIEMPEVFCDAVTISHKHYDHNAVNSVLGKPMLFDKAGFYEIEGVSITGIKTFHDEKEGLSRGENVVYKFRMDGIEVCHLGDIGQPLTPELIELLVPVNVLLIPVGGTYTLDAEQAKEYVDALMPDIVIPMHYKMKNVNIDIDKVDYFVRLFDSGMVEFSEDSFIEVDRVDLNEVSTKVVILKKFES